MAHKIPTDADLRGLLIAALIKSGGSMTFTHLELGEATIAAFNGSIMISDDDGGVTIGFEAADDA